MWTFRGRGFGIYYLNNLTEEQLMASTDTTLNSASSASGSPIIVKLGRQSKKRIKGLSEGRGKLFAEVMQTIEELQKSGHVSGSVQPVIFVVKQEQKLSLFS
jgi:hypothetical protein